MALIMSEKPLILAVDRNHRNLELLSQFLNKEGYQTLAASSLEELMLVLNENTSIGLVLLDISGFDRTIWNYCEQLRDRQIPFLVIYPKQSAAIHQESLSHGASSMLVKPLVIKELLGIIQTLIGNRI